MKKNTITSHNLSRHLCITFGIVAAFSLVCCSEFDDLDNRLDELENEVNNLKNAVSVLQDAYSNGKIISSVEEITTYNGGWKITFSDNSEIEILNGEDGENGECAIIPYILVDQDGFWCVTYDNETLSRIMNNSGNYIKATGEDGHSIRVVTTNDNYYAFVEYAGTEIFDTLKTTYIAKQSVSIYSIAENQQTHIIAITMADGSEFLFNKAYNTPCSIAILSTRRIELAASTTASVEFRVNPSTATFCYDVDSDTCDIQIDYIGTNKSLTSYVSTPQNYKLSKVEQVYDDQGVMKIGQYRAYITDLNVSQSYKERIAFVLTVKDANNQEVQISSSAFDIEFCNNLILSFSFLKKCNGNNVVADANATIADDQITLCSPLLFNCTSLVPSFETNGDKVLVNGQEQISGISAVDFSNPITYTVVGSDGTTKDYVATVSNTNLPVVVINTDNYTTINQKTTWMQNTSITIYNTDGTIDYESSADNIRGRGNSSWGYPKKPYALKLNKKAKLLGMPKHKRWCLLANWMDRTLLRNDVTFEIAKHTGLAWTPNGQFVEVILNNKHIGNYYLCEQIKVDENRVNISELKTTDTDEATITGGYLMELDVYYDEVNKFKSSVCNLPYMFKNPDENVLNEAQFNYMQNYINETETAITTETSLATDEYQNYIDMDSFIDFWFVQELCANGEPCWPKSTYMYKDRDGLLTAGPAWDFDWHTFVNVSEFKTKNALYYKYLFKSSSFIARVKERWSEFKPDFEAIPDYIDTRTQQLSASDALNIELWPISSRVNGDETLTYKDATQQMKDIYTQRLQWLDNAISAL